MKKLAILTSVLALTACGGGSGSAPIMPDAPVVPDVPAMPDSGMRVSDDAIESNELITSMASEILIAQDGTLPNIIRPAHIVHRGNKYLAYHLDDAKFFDNTMESADEYISFGIDENTGEINNMSYHWKENDNDVVESIDRNPNSSIFTEHVYKYKVQLDDGKTYYTDSLPVLPDGQQYEKEQIIDAFKDAYDGEVNESTLDKIIAKVESTDELIATEYVHDHVIDLHGKSLPNSHKLRYSDFGYTTILAKEVNQEGDGTGDDNSVVFGGYEVQQIKNPEQLHDLEFSGKAIAALGKKHGNGNTTIATNDTAAKLTVDEHGVQTLIMPFNDYYTIKVVKPQNGDETITWQGSTNVGHELAANQSVDNQHVEIQYYGNNKKPTEAVGGVFFQNNNTEFNGAFGLSK